MIVFAAIVPHSPLLLPNIGKERQQKLQKTLDSYKELEQDLYASNPDTILIFSPHGATMPNSLGLFISPTYCSNFKEFGDLKTNLEFHSDLNLIDKIQKLRTGKKGLKIQGITEEFSDYGTMVPLYFLAEHLKEVKVVPMSDSTFSLKEHFEYGTKISEALRVYPQRVAVIASADLSHTLTDDAPGGFTHSGKVFDETVVQAIRKNKPKKLLKLDKEMIEAKSCGLKVIATLMGILDEFNWTPEPLSYEGPFGVGYLVTRFAFR